MRPLRTLALACAALVLLTALAYGWDERQALRGGRGVSERTLHGLTLAGGFLGAWVGMRVFRHKTRKPGFVLVLVIVVAALLHAGSWWWWGAT